MKEESNKNNQVAIQSFSQLSEEENKDDNNIPEIFKDRFKESLREISFMPLVAAIFVLLIIFFSKSSSDSLTIKANFAPPDEMEVSSVGPNTPLYLKSNTIVRIPQPPPNLQLESALVKNLATNFYFFELNTNQKWPLASLTKLMTAVVAMEELPLTPETQKLLDQMLIVSSNEAAEKLAESYGNAPKFIQRMNEKAKELGMRNTSFIDPHGLSFLNQTTIEDLEKLINYIIDKHPKILQITRRKSVEVNGETKPSTIEFAGEPNFIGGKTGYTDEAGGNLVSIFQYKGQPILIIVLGARGYEERFEQTRILYQWISKFYK